MKQDLVVLGGGTSGFIVAIGALRLGLKVTLVEKNKSIGGVALHSGCIPSKTLLHAANTTHMVTQTTNLGIDAYIKPINLHKINHYVNTVTDSLLQQESVEVHKTFKQLGGEIIYGCAKFVDEHTVLVDSKQIRAKKVVIATGSRPLYPAIRGLSEIGYITNEEVFKQKKLWDSITILGQDANAIEFAQAFARLGSKVAIVASTDSILPNAESELVNKLTDSLRQSGIEIFVSSKVNRAYYQNGTKVLECIHASGEIYSVVSDEVLVAIGRRPNIEGLGIDCVGIKYAADGILVDSKLRTTVKNIFALGDVIKSPYKQTHIAEYQASIVLTNIIFKYPAKVKYQGFPCVIFTDPEYAHVGISEAQARELGFKKLEIYKFDYKDLDTAIIKNSTEGFIKVVTSKGKILGASILGAHASNLISEWGLAINLKANITDVAANIHAYPTFGQINRRVASKHVNRNVFSERNKDLISFMRRIMLWA